MDSLLIFAKEHIKFTIAMLFLNLIFAVLITTKIYLFFNKHLIEATGGRKTRKTSYKKYISLVREYIEQYEKNTQKENFFSVLYMKSKSKMKKCGKDSNLPVFIYMFLKYIVPLLVFIVAFIANFPNVLPAIAGAALMISCVEYIVNGMKGNLAAEFKNSAYKIYRYLHNQISSGVSVSDAIKSVYRIVDNSKLQDNLILLSASYARTLDIEKSLEEFKSNYDIPEVESLCVALAQGIQTGDNQDILERQEQVMFKQYFNYMQRATDMMRYKSTAVVVVFVLIIIILIGVPLINDVNSSVGKIFVG